MKKILASCLCLLLSVAAFAQSQPTVAPLLANPAFAGILSNARLNTLFISRPTGFPHGRTDAYISYDQLSNRLKGGIGIEGGFSTTLSYRNAQIGLTMTGKYHLGGQWTLTPAFKLQGSYLGSRQQLINQFEYNSYGFTLIPGILLNKHNFYAGLTFRNLPALSIFNGEVSTQGFQFKYLSISAQSGYNFTPKHTDKWSMAFSGVATYFNEYASLQIQNTFRYEAWLLGGGLTVARRFNTAESMIPNVVASLGYKRTKFRIMTSVIIPTATGINLPPSVELSGTFYFPRPELSKSVASLSPFAGQ